MEKGRKIKSTHFRLMAQGLTLCTQGIFLAKNTPPILEVSQINILLHITPESQSSWRQA